MIASLDRSEDGDGIDPDPETPHIGAEGNNNVDFLGSNHGMHIAGIAPRARIMP